MGEGTWSVLMKLPAPLWLFPRRWRHRYGAEAYDVFTASGSRFNDWLDLSVVGLQHRLEDSVHMLLTAGLLMIAAASLVTTGYALAELNDGLREVHRHWWSTAPLAALAASLAMLLLLQVRGASEV
jgi:hypothetical protein